MPSFRSAILPASIILVLSSLVALATVPNSYIQKEWFYTIPIAIVLLGLAAMIFKQEKLLFVCLGTAALMAFPHRNIEKNDLLASSISSSITVGMLSSIKESENIVKSLPKINPDILYLEWTSSDSLFTSLLNSDYPFYQYISLGDINKVLCSKWKLNLISENDNLWHGSIRPNAQNRIHVFVGDLQNLSLNLGLPIAAMEKDPVFFLQTSFDLGNEEIYTGPGIRCLNLKKMDKNQNPIGVLGKYKLGLGSLTNS